MSARRRKSSKSLLDLWQRIANNKTALQYQREVGLAPPLIFDPLDPELRDQPLEVQKKLKAQRSLRDVEPTVNHSNMKLLITKSGEQINERPENENSSLISRLRDGIAKQDIKREM